MHNILISVLIYTWGCPSNTYTVRCTFTNWTAHSIYVRYRYLVSQTAVLGMMLVLLAAVASSRAAVAVTHHHRSGSIYEYKVYVTKHGSCFTILAYLYLYNIKSGRIELFQLHVVGEMCFRYTIRKPVWTRTMSSKPCGESLKQNRNEKNMLIESRVRKT